MGSLQGRIKSSSSDSTDGSVIEYEYGKDNEYCGTPGYFSPEEISFKPYYGYQSDTWAFAVILFQLKFGTLPFDCDP